MIPISFRGLTLNANGLASAFSRSFQRPGTRPIQVPRPGRAPRTTAVDIPAWTLPELGILIEGDGADENALRLGMIRAFDTREAAGALLVVDEDGSNPRYIYATCRELTQKAREAGSGFVATLDVAADQEWLSAELFSVEESIAASGQSVSLTNNGHLDAYPVVTLTPQAQKANGTWERRMFVGLAGQLADGATNYPTLIWSADTTGLTPSQAIDETSVGLFVDGVEVDRWFGGANGAPGGFDSTTTKLWANLDWGPSRYTLLASPISSGGMLGDWGSEVYVQDDISGWPSSGLLAIDGEVMRYRRKDDARKVFLDVSREYGTWDTRPVNSGVQYVEHEIYVVWSAATGVARWPDPNRKPLIDLLASDNHTWVWNGQFGSSSAPTRPGQWQPISTNGDYVFTGDQEGDDTDPFDVMGLSVPKVMRDYPTWQYAFPATIYNFELTAELNGSSVVVGQGRVSADGGATWLRPAKAQENNPTWTEVTIAPSSHIQLLRASLLSFYIASGPLAHQGQVTAAEVTFVSGTTIAPALIFGPRENYSMDLTLYHWQTAESIRLNAPVGLSVFDSLVIDCEGERVVTLVGTWMWDGEEVARVDLETNYYHIMTKSTHRPRMLRLVPGENSIGVYENGLNSVDVKVEWRERRYF